jgi:hypothetical protein
MKAEAVSLDGIVGGEILPYLRSGANLQEFVCGHQYLSVSHAFEYRPELKRTVLGSIYQQDAMLANGPNAGMGGMLRLGSLQLTKVWEHASRQTVPAWAGATLAFYRIDCGGDAGSGARQMRRS